MSNNNTDQEKVWTKEESHAWDMGKYELKLTEQGINTARPIHRIAFLAARRAAQAEYVNVRTMDFETYEKNTNEIKELREQNGILVNCLDFRVNTIIERDIEIQELKLELQKEREKNGTK